MTSILSQYWSEKTPSARKLANIQQIQYFLADKPTSIEGVTAVWAENIFAKEADQYHWRHMPSTYDNHLRLMFYRMELFFRCMNSGDLDADATNTIKKNIAFLDSVLDQVWDEALEAQERMNADWQSTTLNAWLVAEWNIGLHSPGAIRKFIADNGASALTLDAFELGEFRFYTDRSFSKSIFVDWDDYASRVDGVLTGVNYDDSAASVEDTYGLETLSSFVISWLSGIATSIETFVVKSKGV